MRRRMMDAPRALALVGAIGLLAGCVQKGPAERAGASVDRGVQHVKETIDPAGPVEKAGRSVDRALDR